MRGFIKIEKHCVKTWLKSHGGAVIAFSPRQLVEVLCFCGQWRDQSCCAEQFCTVVTSVALALLEPISNKFIKQLKENSCLLPVWIPSFFSPRVLLLLHIQADLKSSV